MMSFKSLFRRIVITSLIINIVVGGDNSLNEQNFFRSAEFVVEELKKISDSGVYNSLSLSRIISAREEVFSAICRYFLLN